MWIGAATNTAFAGPWGVSFTANLTPDKETGLGSWSEEIFIAAMRTGRLTFKSSPNTSATLRLKGVSRSNCIVSGSGVTWGKRLRPRGTLSSWSRNWGRCAPFGAAKSGHVNGRPIRGCHSYMSA